MDAAISEGVPDFVLNARTDAFVQGGDRDPADVLADAVERGKAYLDAGAPTGLRAGPARRGAAHHADRGVRSPAADPDRRPGQLPLARLEELGVARVSYGPMSAAGGAHRPAGAGRGDPPRRRRAGDDARAELRRPWSRPAARPAAPLLLAALGCSACGDDFADWSRRTRRRAPTGSCPLARDGSSYEVDRRGGLVLRPPAEARYRGRQAHRADRRRGRAEAGGRRCSSTWSPASPAPSGCRSRSALRGGSVGPHRLRPDRGAAQRAVRHREEARARSTIRESTCDPEPRLTIRIDARLASERPAECSRWART